MEIKFISKLIVALMLYPVCAYSSQKQITIQCRPGVNHFKGSEAFSELSVVKFNPASPEETLSRRAAEMILNSKGSFKQIKGDLTYELLYRINVSSLNPVFNEAGVWNPAGTQVYFELSVLLREISKDGKVKIVGGSSTDRIIHFNDNGEYNEYDNNLSATVFSPQIYQLAFENPNAEVVDKDFPMSYPDVLRNEYINNKLQQGLLKDSEFESMYLSCSFDLM